MSAFGFAAIAIRGSSNGIYGNLIEHFNIQAIALEFGANANQIGADTPESENVISHTEESPIFFAGTLSGSSRNEVARNHGTGNNGSFIFRLAGNQGVEPPAITTAYPTKASGTATAEATVRVFEAEEGSGSLDRFLGETVADGSGGWTVDLATAAVGAELVATQTVEGATSPFTGVSTVTAESTPPPPDNGGGSTTPPVTGTTPPPTTCAPAGYDDPAEEEAARLQEGLRQEEGQGQGPLRPGQEAPEEDERPLNIRGGVRRSAVGSAPDLGRQEGSARDS